MPIRTSILATAVTAAAVAIGALAAPARSQVTRNMQVLAHFDPYPPTPGNYGYSACWSYIHSDGREYAVIGATCGTLIYNVTNPASTYLVGFIPGRCSIWREMKSYRDWIYVSTEASGSGSPTPGLQIIRMTDPEHPVLAATYAVNFQTSHTVSVDTTRALLICNGTRAWSGPSGYATGMRVLSLADPEAPVEIAWWPGGAIPVSTSNYVHDSVPIGNRLYGASIYAGVERVFDFTNPAAPTEIAQWSYPGAFTHNSWPDASGRYLYVTDEINGEPLKIFDIQSLGAPALVNQITSNDHAIVHNAHVRGNELYLSNYTEGIRVLDLTDPCHPAEFAWADSWPGASGGFASVWEVCPYFPSGTVIASDMQTGLYVYRPVRDYGLLRVKVVDQASGAPLAGVHVHLTPEDEVLATPADGVAVFAPSPGMHDVHAHKFEYETATVSRLVVSGGRDTVVLAIPTVDFSGTVRDAGTLEPLGDADVRLDAPVLDLTDAQGEFLLADVPNGSYTVEAHRPGYVPVSIAGTIDAAHATQGFRLRAAASWDALEMPSGWIVGALGDNATTGIWTRVDPLGTGAVQAAPPPGRLDRGRVFMEGARAGGRTLDPEHEEPEEGHASSGGAQPENDRTPGAGTLCFVTGQGTDPASIGENDVDLGKTTLTSPAFDLTGIADPVIGFWAWVYANTPPDDWLAVLISNDEGASWVPVDTTRGIVNEWTEHAVHVSSYVAPNTHVRLRFVAADLGFESVMEAGIDDVVIYDAAVPAVGVDPGPQRSRFAFAAPRPNPATGPVRLALGLPRAGTVRVDVLDLSGRRIRTLHSGPARAGALELTWDGMNDGGHRAPAGIYYARARLGGETAEARLVRMR